MVKVKVCGVKNLEDAIFAVEMRADFIGLNFWRGTKRNIEMAMAKEVILKVRDKTKAVGVFVNQPLDFVKSVIDEIGIDMVQLHGDESPEYCQQISIPVIKVLRLGNEDDLNLMEKYRDVIWLIDSKTEKYGGSGVKTDWALARRAKEKAGRIILAGGLNPENVKEAIAVVEPWAVDVASGVEIEPGVKDHNKLKAFFNAIKKH